MQGNNNHEETISIDKDLHFIKAFFFCFVLFCWEVYKQQKKNELASFLAINSLHIYANGVRLNFKILCNPNALSCLTPAILWKCITNLSCEGEPSNA